jgi:hypothetical protein
MSVEPTQCAYFNLYSAAGNSYFCYYAGGYETIVGKPLVWLNCGNRRASIPITPKWACVVS